MGEAAKRILKRLDVVFEEESWHVPLHAAVSGLTARQAAWRPSPGRRCIWEIVNHLSLWKEYASARMAGEPSRPPGWARGIDWQEIPEATEDAWNASVRRLLDAQTQLKAQFSGRTDEEFERPLAGSKMPLYAFESAAAHDAYHCGQICYIRALQGVPAKGSWDQ